MRNIQIFILIVSLSFSASNVFSQALSHKLGEILFTSQEQHIKQSLANDFPASMSFQIEEVANFKSPIWKMEFDPTTINELEVLDYLKTLSYIDKPQLNHLVTNRARPNDPMYNQQWHFEYNNDPTVNQMANMDAEAAWDITKGGVTPQGDTVVVCIVDNGFDIDHEDLKENLWINHNEIRNNGIDDDGNGYIDDIYGWNGGSDNGNIPSASHGTQVIGLLGATGDNNIGVSGIVWDTKMMLVVRGGDEASVLRSYSYPFSMRKKYNDTNGEEGAFVVATNSSFGVDFASPDDFPLWCDFYDTMGEVGIISCASTTNNPVNVDIAGDVPTACSSDFLITVTNVTKTNVLSDNVGYGVNSIDIGSYGDETFTTETNDNYGLFADASASCPSVTGVITLMYSAPCMEFAELTKTDPVTAALFVKNEVIQNSTFNSSLAGNTKYERVINAHAPLQSLIDQCDGCTIVTNAEAEAMDANTYSITWNMNTEHDAVNLRIAPIGTEDWIVFEDVEPPFVSTSLDFCTNYKVEFETQCGSTRTEYFGALNFQTQGCCVIVEEPIIQTIDESSISLEWEELTPPREANVFYRIKGDILWIGPIPTINNFISITDLSECEEYEFQIALNCSNQEAFFYTTGSERTTCGNCTGLNYCESPTLSSEFEWIQSVTLNDNTFESGNDNGYSFFPVNDFIITPSQTIDVTIIPTFRFTEFEEAYQIWIDINQNGEFEESEKVFDQEAMISSEIRGSFVVPNNIEFGLTRMRVAMSFGEFVPSCFAATNATTGEIEDYCIEVSPISSQTELIPNEIKIFPNPTDGIINVHNLQGLSNIKVLNIAGQVVHSVLSNQNQLTLNLSGLLQDGIYILSIDNNTTPIIFSKVIVRSNF